VAGGAAVWVVGGAAAGGHCAAAYGLVSPQEADHAAEMPFIKYFF
jgi:hypothetical protein